MVSPPGALSAVTRSSGRKRNQWTSDSLVRSVALLAVWGGLAGVALPGQPQQEADRGEVCGVVVDAANGEALAGAYVAIDHSGDASGANLGRFQKQGIYVTTETDAQGRFELKGVAFHDEHPLMVTLPGFIRHNQTVALRRDEPAINIKIKLNKGATIAVRANDAEGQPLDGETWIRLEAEAGRIFAPMREDWPVTRTRTEKTRDGTARFGELPSGEYSIEVINVRPSMRELAAVVRAKESEHVSGVSAVPYQATYHAATQRLSLEAGETREVAIPPAGYRSEVTIEVAEDPHADPRQPFMGLSVSRNPGRLLWAGRKFVHPEDHRLGRVVQDNMLEVISLPGRPYRLCNFPPGEYAVFVWTIGQYPDFRSLSVFVRGAKVTIREGDAHAVSIGWSDPEGPSFATPRALLAFETKVEVESRSYKVSELCSLLSSKTDSRATFTAGPGLQDQSVKLTATETSIWELLENLHRDYGWEVEAEGDVFTLNSPVD